MPKINNIRMKGIEYIIKDKTFDADCRKADSGGSIRENEEKSLLEKSGTIIVVNVIDIQLRKNKIEIISNNGFLK